MESITICLLKRQDTTPIWIWNFLSVSQLVHAELLKQCVYIYHKFIATQEYSKNSWRATLYIRPNTSLVHQVWTKILGIQIDVLCLLSLISQRLPKVTRHSLTRQQTTLASFALLPFYIFLNKPSWIWSQGRWPIAKTGALKTSSRAILARTGHFKTQAWYVVTVPKS